MTRDPSDGSVKPPTKSAPVPKSSLPSGESEPSVTPACTGADTNSGLPMSSTKPKEISRLNYSREWLKAYHTDPESVARRNGEQGE